MRALVVHPGPQYSVKDVHDGWLHGLEAMEVDVRPCYLDLWLQFYTCAALKKGRRWVQAFDYENACRLAMKHIETACYEWWPDVVVFVSGFFIAPDILDVIRARGHHLVLHCTESPYEDERQLLQAAAFDTVLVNDPLNIERFRQVNPRTWYMPHGWRPGIHEPKPQPETCDVSFVGTGYPSRIEFLEKVDWTGLDVKLGGNWGQLDDASPLIPLVTHPLNECMDNVDALDLYRSSKLSLNLYRKEASAGVSDGIGMGPREVELAASETFFIREPRPESDDLLGFLPSFTDAAELGDLCRWWVHDDRTDERRALARAARLAVADRSYPNLARRLLSLCSTEHVEGRSGNGGNVPCRRMNA